MEADWLSSVPFQELLAALLVQFQSLEQENWRLQEGWDQTAEQSRQLTEGNTLLGETASHNQASLASASFHGDKTRRVAFGLDTKESAISRIATSKDTPKRRLNRGQTVGALVIEEAAVGKKALPSGVVPDVWEYWTKEEVGSKIQPAFSHSEVTTILALSHSSQKETRQSRTALSWLFARMILPPDSWKRVCWDCIALAILGYDVLMIPLMAFHLERGFEMKIMEVITMTIWTVDILMSFITGYRKVYVLEMRPEKIAWRYVKHSFVPDFLIACFDWVMYLFHTGMANAADIIRMSKVIRVVRVIRVLKLLRLLRLPGLLRSVKERIHSDVTMGFLRITRSLLLIIIVNHFVACAWYAIGMSDELRWGGSWVEELVEEERGLAYRYFTALHWSITQFTPASMEVHPRNTPERAFSIIVVFAGLVLFSSFVSSITTTMAALRMARYQDVNTKDKIRRYMSEKSISMKLGSKISTFLESYRFSTQKPVKRDDIPIFKVLPKSLQLSLDWEVHKPVLCRHPFFNYVANIDNVSMLQLCGMVEEISLTTCQELFHPGLQAVGAYFTISGIIRCYHGFDETTPKEINARRHRWLCEPALWLQWRHRGRVVAVTNSFFVVIGPAAVHSVLTSRPRLRRTSREYARLVRRHFECLRGQSAKPRQTPEALEALASTETLEAEDRAVLKTVTEVEDELDTEFLDMQGDFSDDQDIAQEMLNLALRNVAANKKEQPSISSSSTVSRTKDPGVDSSNTEVSTTEVSV